MIFSTLSGGRHIKSHVRVTVSGNELEVYVEPEDNVISNIDIESIMNSIYIRHLNFMPRNRIVWFFCNKKIPVSITKNGRFVVSDGIREIPAKGFTIKGFTIMEVVVALTVSSVLMVGISVLIKSMMNYKFLTDSIQRMQKIEKALETTYRENIRYVEENCYGWTDSYCVNITVLPQRDTANPLKLVLRTYSGYVVETWRSAGCTVTGTAPVYDVVCPDGYGGKFTFTTVNEHTPNTQYLKGYPWYASFPYKITITSSSNPDITDTWSASYLDSEYYVYTQNKVNTLINAIKAYHLSRLTHEATVNTCDPVNGGLQSHDDVIIPWIWQITGNSAVSECTGIEVGICGCSNMINASIWPTSSQLAVIDTATEWANVLLSLGLQTGNIFQRYRVDGFGNPLKWQIINSSTSTAVVPPRPSPNYSWVIKPPYKGVIYVEIPFVWVDRWTIVYPQ